MFPPVSSMSPQISVCSNELCLSEDLNLAFLPILPYQNEFSSPIMIPVTPSVTATPLVQNPLTDLNQNPKPQLDLSEDPLMFSDIDLNYISRMLMEEDIEEKFEQYPENPALLAAQKPFLEILESNSVPSPDQPPLHTINSSGSPDDSFVDSLINYDCNCCDNSPFLDDASAVSFDLDQFFLLETNVNTVPEEYSSQSSFSSTNSNNVALDVLDFLDESLQIQPIWQFNKGVEEASKFLPNRGLIIDLEANRISNSPPITIRPEKENKIAKEKEREREREREAIIKLMEEKQYWLPHHVSTSLESAGVEYLLSHKGKVPVSIIKDKFICLLFSAKWCKPCNSFMAKLLDLYKSLKSTSPCNLEILFVSLDHNESSFLDHFKEMPWLAVPFDGKISQKLRFTFHVEQIPSLIPLISVDGKVLVEEDAVRLVESYGVDAFPFGVKRRKELEATDEAMRQGGKLEELIGCKDRNYLISKDDSKVPIADLVGKTIGLYFGAHWCPPSRAFTKMLIETYNELANSEVGSFEIVFISMDRDETEFMKSLEEMPWLAIPYSDKIRHDTSRIFDVKLIPNIVILGANGETMSRDGRTMIAKYGSLAFPFTEKRAKEVEGMLEEEGKRLPHHVSDPRHEHVLKLDMAGNYVCDACRRSGRFWVFSCSQCDFDLHPSCHQESF